MYFCLTCLRRLVKGKVWVQTAFPKLCQVRRKIVSFPRNLNDPGLNCSFPDSFPRWLAFVTPFEQNLFRQMAFSGRVPFGLELKVPTRRAAWSMHFLIQIHSLVLIIHKCNVPGWVLCSMLEEGIRKRFICILLLYLAITLTAQISKVEIRRSQRLSPLVLLQPVVL